MIKLFNKTLKAIYVKKNMSFRIKYIKKIAKKTDEYVFEKFVNDFIINYEKFVDINSFEIGWEGDISLLDFLDMNPQYTHLMNIDKIDFIEKNANDLDYGKEFIEFTERTIKEIKILKLKEKINYK